MRRSSKIIKELPNPYRDLLMKDLVSDSIVQNMNGLYSILDRNKRDNYRPLLNIIFHTENLGNKCINWDSHEKAI